MGRKVKPIFLYDLSLYWERPTPEGEICLSQPNGNLKLLKALNLSSIKENVGLYTIHASAMKYLAEVIRVDPNNETRGIGEKAKGTPNSETIFNGNITIYRYGKIKGEKIIAYDKVSSGEIWLGFPYPKTPLGQISLSQVIFWDKETISGKVRRIESIILGYNQREEAAARRGINALDVAYGRGSNDAMEGEHGTYGYGRHTIAD